MKDFYLLIDVDIISSYLMSEWIENFADFSAFKGVLIGEDKPSEKVLQNRKAFHAKYGGQNQLTTEINRQLVEIYPDIDDVGKTMIRLFGIPKYTPTHHSKTIFLGKNINGEYAQNWLKETCKKSQPWFFSYIWRILKPWWIYITHRHILNCHPAVLPYARGMYSIENIAILRDIVLFKKVTGITIHYVDEGIDTGSIIRAEKIINPFQFNSIWELKGYAYFLGNELYVKTAREILNHPTIIPAGIVPNSELRGPNFLNKLFTQEKRKQAEEGYLAMKNVTSQEL